MARAKRSFGGIRQLPSGRYQANYTGPDARLHKAPMTFDAREDAEAWLADVRRLISRGEWTSKPRRNETLTLSRYSEMWLDGRALKPRTREHYRGLLDHQILPEFGDVPLRQIDPDDVRDWWISLGPSRPTLRSHAYGLLRTVLGSAVQDRLIEINPCHIRGAGNVRRVHKIRPASLDELETVVAAMPPRYQMMTLLASWCALRFGELAELRRDDIDLKKGVIRIRRAMVRANGKIVVGTPKSSAGVRDVAVPPHLFSALKEHLDQHAQPGRDGLLFPSAAGGHLATSTLYKVYYPARSAAGRPDLRWHDLRHSGAVLAAQTGATLAELMSRLGHSTPAAALRYQHAAEGRDLEIARRLSALVESPASG
jgi:integrase